MPPPPMSFSPLTVGTARSCTAKSPSDIARHSIAPCLGAATNSDTTVCTYSFNVSCSGSGSNSTSRSR